ncbi:hypothetical protein HRbin36_01394 [bacterium HR36]|nr:hypothetical protein HRbin36_01394 [bacterium HR36]
MAIAESHEQGHGGRVWEAVGYARSAFQAMYRIYENRCQNDAADVAISRLLRRVRTPVDTITSTGSHQPI